MILGSLSANGCGFVPVLLLFLAHGVQHFSLLVLEWSWAVALRWRLVGEFLPFDILWNWEISGGSMP